jgi:hypothetical protein
MEFHGEDRRHFTADPYSPRSCSSTDAARRPLTETHLVAILHARGHIINPFYVDTGGEASVTDSDSISNHTNSCQAYEFENSGIMAQARQAAGWHIAGLQTIITSIVSRSKIMAESHVVSALVNKRAEITGVIARAEQLLGQFRADLVHLDATLRLFAPELEPKTIPANRSGSPIPGLISESSRAACTTR